MANHALLNNIEHKDLKIITDKSAEFGNNQMYSVVYPFEFKQVQAQYPIFFHKNNNGEFIALAMFGFEQGENLYLTEDGWQADYIPMMVEREPFFIGIQQQTVAGETVQNEVIHIDLDSPRVNSEQGEALFEEQGGNSEYLKRISSILKTIHDGQTTTKEFVDTMIEHELLESFSLDITLKNGSTNRLQGFYTINEEKLYGLSADVLHRLNSSGMLLMVYMVLASQSQLSSLIARKNAKHVG